MKIIASDPAVDQETMEKHLVEKVTIDDLLGRSDFVSLHVPLSAKTHHLIGERELRLLRPRAVLINTARGGLIDQQALVRALLEKWFAAAGLDVLESEPPAPDDPVLKLENVMPGFFSRTRLRRRIEQPGGRDAVLDVESPPVDWQEE